MLKSGTEETPGRLTVSRAANNKEYDARFLHGANISTVIGHIPGSSKHLSSPTGKILITVRYEPRPLLHVMQARDERGDSGPFSLVPDPTFHTRQCQPNREIQEVNICRI